VAAVAQDAPKDVPPTATLSFIIVRESSGKPVRNAEIVLHLLDKNGNQKQDGLELKTHDDGKTETGGIPYGKMRIQVIASGFRTYGEDYVIDKPTLEITIKLQKPKDQFSIYK
jgi:5-hydroxyisourate hydrolase-like protein (transthyretin family)